jgi:hypothetical protein
LFDRSDSFWHGTPFRRAVRFVIGPRARLSDISGRTSEFHKFSPPILKWRARMFDAIRAVGFAH